MSLKTIELPQGEITYRDEGEGPVIFFSHGFLVDSELWEPLAQRLVARGYRCVRPNSPLGSHHKPMNPDADLSPPGLRTFSQVSSRSLISIRSRLLATIRAGRSPRCSLPGTRIGSPR